MNILFIHGMNQQNYNADSLRQHWLTLLQAGLHQQNIDLPIEQLSIDFPFYGDLLSKHQLSNSLDLGTMMPKVWSKFKLPFHLHHASTPTTNSGRVQPFVQAQDPCLCTLPSHQDIAPQTLTQRFTLASALAKDRVLKELIIFLNHYPHLHRQLMHQFLIESYMYLDNAEFMQQVHERILDKIQPNHDYLVVAHSLGSVIAYNLMQNHSLSNIQHLITLGSPLAFKVIQQQLTQPIQRPAYFYGDWINFYSTEDFLTAFPLSEAPFDFIPPIQNYAIKTLANNPHQLAGYLTHPLVIQRIASVF